jgi:hypothetical protein
MLASNAANAATGARRPDRDLRPRRLGDMGLGARRLIFAPAVDRIGLRHRLDDVAVLECVAGK